MLGRGLRPPEDGVVRHRRPECSWPLVLHVVCHLSGRVGLKSILGLYGRRSGEKKQMTPTSDLEPRSLETLVWYISWRTR